MKIHRVLQYVLVISLLSCSSEGPHTPGYVPSFVAGYVTNPDTSPAAGVQVDLMGDDWIVAPPMDVHVWAVLLSTCTNENGYFSFRFDYVANRQHGVQIHWAGGLPLRIEPGENKYVSLVAENPIDSIAFGDCP